MKTVYWAFSTEDTTTDRQFDTLEEAKEYLKSLSKPKVVTESTYQNDEDARTDHNVVNEETIISE